MKVLDQVESRATNRAKKQIIKTKILSTNVKYINFWYSVKFQLTYIDILCSELLQTMSSLLENSKKILIQTKLVLFCFI